MGNLRLFFSPFRACCRFRLARVLAEFGCFIRYSFSACSLSKSARRKVVSFLHSIHLSLMSILPKLFLLIEFPHSLHIHGVQKSPWLILSTLTGRNNLYVKIFILPRLRALHIFYKASCASSHKRVHASPLSRTACLFSILFLSALYLRYYSPHIFPRLKLAREESIPKGKNSRLGFMEEGLAVRTNRAI